LVHSFLERTAHDRPDAPAVLHGAEQATYLDVERGANRIAHRLLAAGVHPGDRVGLLADNSRRYVEAFFGVLKAGGIVVPLNTAAESTLLGALLHDCEARALLVDSGRADLGARSCVAATLDPVRAVLPLEPAGEGEAAPPKVARSGQDRAAIVYTSGSTGRPKGAVLRHANIVANANSIVSYLGLGPADRMLVVLPFFYVYGQSLLVTHVAAGASLAIENRFLFPSVVVDSLARSEATGFAGVPSTFAILLHKTDFAQRSFPALRYVTQAGGAMAPALTQRLIEALPGKQIFVMYGATEASARLSFLPPDQLASHLGSIGRAIPGVELRVLREDGSEAAVGEVGEIVARGPNIMEGYWGDPEETLRVLDEAGYHTGDLARRDDSGFLWIVGRKRDMIKAGAHRISPKEIEEALLEHPGLLEVAVIGVPDEILGEAIEAHVVLRPDASTDARQLEAFVRERLPAYKTPRRFIVHAELPKSAAGKILKDVLRTAPRRP